MPESRNKVTIQQIITGLFITGIFIAGFFITGNPDPLTGGGFGAMMVYREAGMGWEVEFTTETSYMVRWYATESLANWAADDWLRRQDPFDDPKVWVRPARSNPSR